MLGLDKIVDIRQYTWFTPAGKMERRYEVKFTTDKTEGEFTFDLSMEEYTRELATETAKERANEIDDVIG